MFTVNLDTYELSGRS